MVQSRLDPEAEEAARVGGWGILRKQRSTKSVKLRLAQVARFLDGLDTGSDPKVSEATDDKKPASRHRWTVWFNAWKYETSEQLWAGLVDAIVTQITDRPRPDQRELFLLRLNLARLDNNIIRQRIHERVLGTWWASICPWIVGTGCATLGLLGIRLTGADLSTHLHLAIGGLPALGGVYAVFEFFRAKNKADCEPAKFTLSDYIKVPDYTRTVGTIHQVYEDLRKVFSVVPKDHLPLVVFIDDLDRCGPDKVAKVVEGVNLFMAGDILECMFVIGMDPQMVATALQTAHASLLDKLPSYDRQTLIGWRFMDKFVQMAFTIPPSDPDEVVEYANALLSGPEISADEVKHSSPENAKSLPVGDQDARLAGGAALEAGANSSSVLDLEQREIIASKVLTGDDPSVRKMMRDLAPEFSRNPRDLKRLLNLLRFQVLVMRMRAADGRSAPGDAQLQRWITLSLRSPDVVRWLQWTPEQSTRFGAGPDTNLLSERLAALEAIADRVTDPEIWKGAIVATFGLQETGVSWLDDPNLLAFFRREAKLLPAQRLSAGALRGYC